jgi:hypothetical protein
VAYPANSYFEYASFFAVLLHKTAKNDAYSKLSFAARGSKSFLVFLTRTNLDWFNPDM